MKTFLPFKIGQCLQPGTQSNASEGFSFNIPQGDALIKKGAVFVFVSSAEVDADCRVIARRLVNDYSATSQVWSVTEAIERVLAVAQTFLARCSFSMLVIKGTTAHIVQHGNTSLVRYRQGGVECLSNMGGHRIKKVATTAGEVFCLAPPVMREPLMSSLLIDCIKAKEDDLNHTAFGMTRALEHRGPELRRSVALIEVADLPQALMQDVVETVSSPPMLSEGDTYEGYRVLSMLSESPRSRVYRVSDGDVEFALKCPLTELVQRQEREAFLLQEWLLQRLEHPAIVASVPQQSKRQSFYLLTPFVDAPTLGQWLAAREPTIDRVLAVVEQLGKALLSMHRAGVYHRALSLDNCLIGHEDRVYVIDMSASYVNGVGACGPIPQELLGTTLLAPELARGEPGTEASDQYMLAALTYTLLNKGNAPAVQGYSPLETCNAELSPGLDECLQKALSDDPLDRFGDVAEFIHALKHPATKNNEAPLRRHWPVVFWQGLSLMLGMGWLITLMALWR
jgi:hypothetical protein